MQTSQFWTWQPKKYKNSNSHTNHLKKLFSKIERIPFLDYIKRLIENLEL